MDETLLKPTYQWRSAAISDAGKVRSLNEDSLIERPDLALWAVADGMGGHHGGEVASRMVVEGLSQIQSPSKNLNNYINAVEDSLQSTNAVLRKMSEEKYSSRTIGSTVICLIADHTHIAYLWAGDSRLYRLRRGQLTQLSTDHSEVQRLVDEGLIRPEDAEKHPSANVVTRAVGGHDVLALQLGLDTVKDNDVFLLCSDGLYRDLSHEEIENVLNQHQGVQDKCDALLGLALSRRGADNISLIVTRVEKNN
ncbi:MAG: protein phosphatase 2C domain-containing protein [Gammaproteobacteria bacterium]|nr:protein phosphatase 2C domain-containing protein [Gammaproteobacteria bacterium]